MGRCPLMCEIFFVLSCVSIKTVSSFAVKYALVELPRCIGPTVHSDAPPGQASALPGSASTSDICVLCIITFYNDHTRLSQCKAAEFGYHIVCSRTIADHPGSGTASALDSGPSAHRPPMLLISSECVRRGQAPHPRAS
jgi:hypothetical protein